MGRNKRIQCDICKKLVWAANFERHTLAVHSKERPFKCKYCDKNFNDPSAVGRHQQLHEAKNVKSFECSMCDMKFTTHFYLKGHLKWHSAEKYQCEQCPSVIKGKGSFHEHIKTHSTALKCSLCDRIFTRTHQLTKHMNGFHNLGQRVSCTLCNSTFKMKEHLNKHMNYKHSPKDKHKCETCNKYFSQEGSLYIHRKIHKGERFQCSLCEASYAQKFHFKNHLAKVHSVGKFEKRFVCSVCHKKFERKAILQDHMSNHTGIKPYKCDFCDYKVALRGTLTVHLRRCKKKSINQSKEFKCKDCPYSSAVKAHLERHLMKHKDPELKCDLCEYKARYKHNLTKHKANHLNGN